LITWRFSGKGQSSFCNWKDIIRGGSSKKSSNHNYDKTATTTKLRQTDYYIISTRHLLIQASPLKSRNITAVYFTNFDQPIARPGHAKCVKIVTYTRSHRGRYIEDSI
jgi:hypothetical protein